MKQYHILWESKIDNLYDVFVYCTEETGNYDGYLVIKDGKTTLLKEKTDFVYGAKFGIDDEDIQKWEKRCVDFINCL